MWQDMKCRQSEMQKNTSRIKRIAFCGVFTALAMIFSYIESIIAIPIGIPGVKLGVANIAIIVVIYIVGYTEAVVVNFIRIALTGIMFGNIYSFLFSLAGGMLSVITMVLLKKTGIFSMLGVSIAGGVVHNIGQIIAAVFLMENKAIAYYLPALLATGIITGVIIGTVGQIIAKRINLAAKS